MTISRPLAGSRDPGSGDACSSIVILPSYPRAARGTASELRGVMHALRAYRERVEGITLPSDVWGRWVTDRSHKTRIAGLSYAWRTRPVDVYSGNCVSFFH